ncbi:ABC transporter ATP-binding protein [Lactobacillus sp. ESL0791]|uniref:ABC transporter ATP-binding protein n=1 Tax=Lactobacillus sp. ESL0791 TaxID=2983234 RepID=UPI0023F79551|nr:ABC transporter ATP-binding protein [Lactobacillus sp. ESL0791]MDF7639888.1 ABC transporter ATP-binding protein [Lactobacillus sp. ESL0791]
MKDKQEVKLLLHETNKLYPHVLAVQVIRAVINSLIDILNVLFLGLEVNILVTKQNWSLALKVGLLFLTIKFILNIADNYFSELADRHSRLLNQRAQAQISRHLVQVDYETFMSPKFRQLYSDISEGMQFTGGFQQFIANVVNDFASFVVTLLTSGTIVCYILVKGWQQAAVNGQGPIFLVFLLMAVILPLYLSEKVGNWSGKIFQQFFAVNIKFNRLLSYYLEYAFTEISVNKLLRLFDPENTYLQHAKKQIINGTDRDEKIQSKALGVYVVSDLATSLAIGLLYVVIGLFIVQGGLSIGNLISAVGTLELLITSLGNLFSSWGKRAGSFKTMEQFSEFMQMGEEKSADKPKLLKTTDFTVEFVHVSYRYPGQETYALQDVSLTLKSGVKTALVGQNGSGKTTLVKLLLRLVRPTAGKILFNGQDIADLDLKNYQDFFAVVSQHFFLTAESLAKNVAADRKIISAKVQNALTEVGLDKKVAGLELGIETPVSNVLSEQGVNFSGGEQQKLAIARAVYRDSKFYVLDEPTAALDPLAEAEVFDQFADLTHKQTALFISHRMSSTRASDYIYVLDKGQLVQQGTHAQLMKKPGIYSNLYKAQAEFFKK